MATPDTLGVGPKPITSGITATASSTYGAGWEPAKAFDGVIGDSGASWSAATGVPGWLQAQLATPAAVSSYKIYARTGTAYTTPSAWTFDGSNDGSSWTTLDSQTGQTWLGGQGRAYTFSNSTAYTYYRLSITATQSAGALPALTEFILYEGTATTLLDWWKADAITGVADAATLTAASIPDSSGNSHIFTTDVRAGVYRAASGPGGMPFIDGSTTSGFVYSGPAKPAPTDDLTYFAVLRTGSAAVQSIIGSVNNNGAQLRLNNYFVELDQDGVTTVATSTKPVPANSWTIVIVSYQQSTGQYKVNIHGTKESITGPANRVFTSPGSTLSFGGYRGTTSNAWLGGIAELGRYTSVLSDSDQAELYDYLVAKYFPNPSLTQVEGVYTEAMATGIPASNVEANYLEAMATGVTNAQVATNYVEAMALVLPAQVETVYAELMTGGTPPSQVEGVYMEIMTLSSSSQVQFTGWGLPI